MTRWTKGRLLMLAVMLAAALLLFGCSSGDKGDTGPPGTPPSADEVAAALLADPTAVEALQGEAGDKGDKGDTGDTGDTGAGADPAEVTMMVKRDIVRTAVIDKIVMEATRLATAAGDTIDDRHLEAAVRSVLMGLNTMHEGTLSLPAANVLRSGINTSLEAQPSTLSAAKAAEMVATALYDTYGESAVADSSLDDAVAYVLKGDPGAQGDPGADADPADLDAVATQAQMQLKTSAIRTDAIGDIVREATAAAGGTATNITVAHIVTAAIKVLGALADQNDGAAATMKMATAYKATLLPAAMMARVNPVASDSRDHMDASGDGVV